MRRSLHLVRMVKREYHRALSRDDTLAKDLTAIETIHFNVRPQQGGLEGLFGSMFGALMG